MNSIGFIFVINILSFRQVQKKALKILPMNKLLIFCILLTGVSVQAQVFVNKVNVSAESIAYLEVWEKYDEQRQSYVAMVDYGQKDDRNTDKEGYRLRITNEKGAVLDFNGIVHIINYLHKQGWELFHVKTLGKYESYIMRRSSPENLNFSRARNSSKKVQSNTFFIYLKQLYLYNIF